MKEFEKWNKEKIKGIVYPYRTMYTNLHKDAWKAALEWVLLLYSVRINHDVYEAIKRELEK